MDDHLKPSYEFGPYHLDRARRQLLREGVAVPLTPKVFDTLLYLVENSDRVVEKDELIERLWPDSFVEERNIAQNIFTLRKALGESGSDRYIETVPRRGYRFVAAVRPLTDDRAEVIVARRVRSEIVIEEEDVSAEREAPSGQKALPPAGWMGRLTRSQSIGAIILGIVLLAGIIAGVYLLVRGRFEGPRSVAGVRSIAVLPFKPMAGSDAGEYLGVGLADALITRLSHLRQIMVRPTRAVLKYTDSEQDPAAAGRELTVDSVLHGLIQRDGERVRVTVQLVRVSDGATLWGDRFDERFTNIFNVQDSISDKVAQKMMLELSSEEKRQLNRRYTTSTEAFEAYLKGRYHWNKRTEEGLRRAVDHYKEALEKDHDYALAYVGLAECYALYSTYAVLPAQQAFPLAEAAALKALEIDERLAEAHAALGVVRYEYNRDWKGADQEFKRAIELNSNYATAHQWYGGFLISQGKFDEGIAEIKRARELDPLSPIINASVGWFLYFARRYDEAITEGRNALSLEGNSGIAHYFIAQAYLKKGMYEEAIAELHRSLSLSPNDGDSRATLVQAYTLAGDKEKAR
ncbi:MAG TPA: winged helix-turn-helix domain-containing protein, partial [Blastocatellia bacterium]|nr:winged helix-turn-helix domain-containing protein [Blastocatellia bacterium]